jgi:uncharacterized protein YdeI (YjbR/CyaY-like superfamily)
MDGVDLADPDGLLKGTGKRLRHIKFKTVAEVEQLESQVRDLLEQAKTYKQ